jgi:hypothetical protein
VLVADGADRRQRVGLEREPLADRGGDDRGLVVDRDDGVDRQATREVGDGRGTRLRIGEVEREE